MKSISKPRRRKSSRTKPRRIDVAAIRREQVVAAAANIIALRGIQSLSLSEIEAETGMSRGQLTYYFPTKEDILLAVFDRTVHRMRDQMGHGGRTPDGHSPDLIEALLTKLLLQPLPVDFTQLQYSFLAQTGFREDFRDRLASLYEQWRTHMTDALAHSHPNNTVGDRRLYASFVQALLHGLVMQRQADPNAFDCASMFRLCMEVLNRSFRTSSANGQKVNRTNGRASARSLRNV